MEEPKEKNSVKESSDLPKNDLPESGLAEKIKQSAQGLSYISETDAEISAFRGKQSETVSKEVLLQQTGRAGDAPVEEKNFADFFARLTEMQDWFEAEEKATAEKFAQLKQVLEQNLRDLKVFKIGTVQLDVYVVGLDAENFLTGIQTKAVET